MSKFYVEIDGEKHQFVKLLPGEKGCEECSLSEHCKEGVISCEDIEVGCLNPKKFRFERYDPARETKGIFVTIEGVTHELIRDTNQLPCGNCSIRKHCGSISCMSWVKDYKYPYYYKFRKLKKK